MMDRLRNGLTKYKSELELNADVLLVLYVVGFSVFTDRLRTNIYTNAIAVFFMFLTVVYCFIDSKNLINKFSVSFFLFCLFFFISSLWSPTKDFTLLNAKRFVRLFIMHSLMYNYLASTNKKELILKAFVYAGLCVCVYTVLHYGPKEYLRRVMSGERMGTDIYEINNVAYILVTSSLISIWFAISEKRWWNWVSALFCLFISIGTGSRASILAFAVGIFALILLVSKGKWRIINPLLIICAIIIGFQLLKLPAFGTLRSRLESMLNFFTDKDAADSSTIVRINMIKWGFEQFLKTPVFGLGMSSGAEVMGAHGVELVVYHNTYVEVLAGGGIVGFCLYFFMYFYPLARLIKPASKGDSFAIIGITLLATYLLVILNAGTEMYEKPAPLVICYLFLAVHDLDKTNSV